jgi:hypothetical protein
LRIEFISAEERKIVETTPENGFVAKFEKWAAMKTDAAPYGLHAAALQALSLAAGDVVALPPFFGTRPVYMNLYIMLVGPSTTMRKTTVLGFVRDLLPRNARTNENIVRFLDDVSIQAFNKEMAKAGKLEAPIILSVDEVAGLFQVVRKQGSYLSGFDKTLMKAYDHSPVHIARVGSNVDSDRGAFVNVFAASTPEPLVEVLNAEDLQSGLLPRFIIFDVREAVRGHRVPLGQRLAKHDKWEEMQHELQAFLADVMEHRCGGVAVKFEGDSVEFEKTILSISDEALDRIDRFDAEFQKDVHSDDTVVGAIKGRALWHIVKIAGLYALSREGKTATVQLIDVLRAAHLMETTVEDLLVMREEIGANLLERRVKEVESILRQSSRREMKRSVVVRRMSLSAWDAKNLQDTLLVRDLIEIRKSAENDLLWKWK